MILCVGVVTSVFLFSRNKSAGTNTENTANITPKSYRNIDENTNKDWKNILVNVDTSESATTILTNDDENSFNETTLTAQMSRDFLSQYLLAIKNGPLTTEDSDAIARNTLSIEGYTNISGAKYLATNLHITTKSDQVTLQKYEDTVNKMLKIRSLEVKEDPTTIFQDSINSASEVRLAKLDPIILSNKGFLTDLLSVEVPEKAVTVHLALLNASSNILSDLEGMRLVFVDPVRSLTAVGQYNNHISDLKTAVENIAGFFAQN